MLKIPFRQLKTFMTPIIIERYEANAEDDDYDVKEIEKEIKQIKHYEQLCELITEVLGYEDPQGFILDNIIS